ncbi:hypothetical protein Tco_1060427, partial [Tanacetum coccineum]
TLDQREKSMTQEFYDLVEDAQMVDVSEDQIIFFGAIEGKKADIKRCPAILANREKYIKLLNKKPLEQSFGLMERHAVDLKIMRGLCANGIPFNVLRNPQFHEMVSAINKAPPGYKAPSSEKARTVLLDECARDVEKDLTSIQDTWFTQGVSIVSDGWSNVKHEPLINVLAVNSRGATFLHAKDFSGVKKTGEAIANYLLGAIEKIGPSHVLQVVTDNAENCKAAGKEIEKLKKDCREALATTVVLNSWREWAKQGDENTKKTRELVVQTIQSESFWIDVDHILAVTKPIFLLIKFCDGDGPRMGEIYERMDNMMGQNDNPITLLGLLTPRFYDTRYIEALAPRGQQRRAPNLDKEQFATFTMKKGLFALPGALMDAVTMDAVDWWSTYGSETPELADVAKKVLSQPISSSSAERNRSTYSYIHSVKRNRLNNKRADKLVYIHSNIRLLSRFTDSYKGPPKKWDMNPESTNLEGSTSRLEDM